MVPWKDRTARSAGIWGRKRKIPGLVQQERIRRYGYKVPTTWKELEELQKMIISDGDTPWAIGIESGAATGWWQPTGSRK